MSKEKRESLLKKAKHIYRNSTQHKEYYRFAVLSTPECEQTPSPEKENLCWGK